MVSVRGNLRLTHEVLVVLVQIKLRPDSRCHPHLRRVLHPGHRRGAVLLRLPRAILRKEQVPRLGARGQVPVEGNLRLVPSPHAGILASPRKLL